MTGTCLPLRDYEIKPKYANFYRFNQHSMPPQTGLEPTAGMHTAVPPYSRVCQRSREFSSVSLASRPNGGAILTSSDYSNCPVYDFVKEASVA